MYPVSAKFLSTLPYSHKVATRAEVWSGVTASAAAELLATFDVQSGSVKLDTTASVRRQSTAVLFDPTGALTPADATDLFGVGGNEVRLYRGIHYTDGTADELCPLGVFRTGVSEVSDGPSGLTVTLTGYDRSRQISRAALRTPLTLAANLTAPAAITQVLDAVASQFVSLFAPNLDGVIGTAELPALSWNAGSDPWKAITDIAAAVGGQALFDVNGLLVVRTVPDPSTTAVSDTYSEGAGAKLIDSKRRFDDQYVVNDWIVNGQSSSTNPSTGEAYDSNPASPTYVDSFGWVTKVQSSSLVSTDAQAQAMAQGLLMGTTGLVQDVQFDGWVNPALDGDDVVQITRKASNIDGLYSIQTLQIPLTAADKMAGTTKQRV